MSIIKRILKGFPLTWAEVDQNFDSLDTLKADKTALATEVIRATAAENLKAPINSPAFTGTVTGVTKAMVGLTNAEDKSSATIRGEITNLNVTTALGYTPENAIRKGAANGYAPLDGTSKVPSEYLPSYVDDVLEFATVSALPAVGESGKIYVITSGADINKQYRWSGTTYIELPASGGASAVDPVAMSIIFGA